MFTGIIEEIGTLRRIQPIAGGKRLGIRALKIIDDLKPDDSVAINGVCLTVTQLEADGFWIDAVGETLQKSTLNDMGEGAGVNLERAIRLQDRLGGHLLQGHVNGRARITQIVKRGENYYLEVDLPREITKYVIDEGSIALDGISLTIASLKGMKAGISVIPHTWTHTNLKQRKVNDMINVETDVIARYIERLLKHSEDKDVFTDAWFKKLGY